MTSETRNRWDFLAFLEQLEGRSPPASASSPSLTTSPPTRPRRSGTGWPSTRAGSSSSRPSTPAGSTRSRSSCATRRHAKGEQGRRTLIRAGCKAGPGLMQRPGEAGGSRGAGSRADGGSSPDNVAAGWHCQTPECAQARPRGRARAKRWLKPLDRISGPEPGGYGARAATASPRRLATRAGPGSSIRYRWPEGRCDCPPEALQG